jgi:hypothetical protein
MRDEQGAPPPDQCQPAERWRPTAATIRILAELLLTLDQRETETAQHKGPAGTEPDEAAARKQRR